jgi:hypothetical protein
MKDRELLTIDEGRVLRQANDAFVRVLANAGVGEVQTEV